LSKLFAVAVTDLAKFSAVARNVGFSRQRCGCAAVLPRERGVPFRILCAHIVV